MSHAPLALGSCPNCGRAIGGAAVVGFVYFIAIAIAMIGAVLLPVVVRGAVSARSS